MAAIAAGMNSTQAPFRSCENQIQEFRKIVARQLDSFRAIALRHLRNHADAEDAVQDALLSAYAHLDQFKGQAQNVHVADHNCDQCRSPETTATFTECAHLTGRAGPRNTFTVVGNAPTC